MTKLRDDLRDAYGVNTTEGSPDIDYTGNLTHTGDTAQTGDTTQVGHTGDTTLVGTSTHTGGVIQGLTVVNAATYTVLESDRLLHVTYTGAVTITIPTALAQTGRSLEVKAANVTSLNPITVNTEGSELIEGEANTVMYNDYGKISLYSDGTDWFLGQAFGQQTYPNVYAYVSTPGDTTITVADTFYPVEATFMNPHADGFTIGASGITYDLAETRTFEVDWSATVGSADATNTVHIGIAVNGETLTSASPTVMGMFFRYAVDPLNLSGTAVVTLAQTDTVSLEITSDSGGNVITTSNFNTTIRPFER